jgi:hypothetical protein
MTIQRIKALVDKKPFSPFNVHMADGDIVEVKSPEFIWMHPTGRVIYVATGSDEQADDRIIDLLLVTQVSTSNGLDQGFPPSRKPQAG